MLAQERIGFLRKLLTQEEEATPKTKLPSEYKTAAHMAKTFGDSGEEGSKHAMKVRATAHKVAGEVAAAHGFKKLAQWHSGSHQALKKDLKAKKIRKLDLDPDAVKSAIARSHEKLAKRIAAEKAKKAAAKAEAEKKAAAGVDPEAEKKAKDAEKMKKLGTSRTGANIDPEDRVRVKCSNCGSSYYSSPDKKGDCPNPTCKDSSSEA